MRKSLQLALLLFFALSFNPNTIFALNSERDSVNSIEDFKWDRFSLTAGGFIAGLNSDMQIVSEGLGFGVIINLEDALGLKTSTGVFRTEAEYVFGKKEKGSVRLSYFNMARSSSKTTETEVEIGKLVFPIGSRVESKFNLAIIKGLYNYAFYKDQRVKLGFSAGLFVMPISFAAKIDNNEGEAARFTAPLPVVGLDAVFTINPKLRLKQSFEILYFSIANFKGGISDINLKLEYDPWKHFGFGLGLNSYRLNITSFKENSDFFKFKGNVAMSYTGVSLYARYFF